MYQSMHQDYLESEVLSADPVKLVQMLYRGTLEAVSTARTALRGGDIRARSSKISKASAILNELAATLDHKQTPDLCRNLVELYDYMLRRLIEANTKQVEEPLIEVERLLGSLLEAWQEIGESHALAEPRATVPDEVEPVMPYEVEPAMPYEQFSYVY